MKQKRIPSPKHELSVEKMENPKLGCCPGTKHENPKFVVQKSKKKKKN